jgi:hypothetical protein
MTEPAFLILFVQDLKNRDDAAKWVAGSNGGRMSASATVDIDDTSPP